MEFAIGYQLPDEDRSSVVDVVRDFSGHISEVYFAWWDAPSGRSPVTGRDGCVDYGAQERMEQDLRALRGLGVRLDLLLNASCYGAHAASEWLENRTGSLIEFLLERVGINVVTTQSPLLAAFVRRNFPGIEIRASVNMRLGTRQAFEYVEGLFDSFYLQREYNRDLERLASLADWCHARQKRIHLLANSGCLAWCAAQTYHDNLVAHEAEAERLKPATTRLQTLCREHLRVRKHWVSLLQSTWIRPEDAHHYEGRVDGMKLATRMHANPRAVVSAYARGRHEGNLLDLLEPGFGPLLAPSILDNRRFPADWFERTTSCGRLCDRCGYCARVLEQILSPRQDVQEEEDVCSDPALRLSVFA